MTVPLYIYIFLLEAGFDKKGRFTQALTSQKLTINRNTHFSTSKTITMNSSNTYKNRNLPSHERLVPDETVQKVTSKHHKMDEKPPILRSMFLHKCLIKKENYPITPSAHQIASWAEFKNINVDGEARTDVF